MKLVLFVPCEKLLFDNSGAASIIVLMGAVKLGTQPNVPRQALTPNTVAPKEWVMVAMWRVFPEERQRDFVQIFRMIWPDGSEFYLHRMPFRTTDHEQSVNYVNLNAMPVGQIGKLHLETWVEEPSGNIISEVADFYLSIEHEIPV